MAGQVWIYFFVLSGFLISYHLLRQWPEKGLSKLTFIAKYRGKESFARFLYITRRLLLSILILISIMSSKEWMKIVDQWEATAIILYILAILFSLAVHIYTFLRKH